MFAVISNRLQVRRVRRHARERYDQHVDFLRWILWEEDYSRARGRIKNLTLAVQAAVDMARECRIFDNDRFDHDGYTPEEWHLNEASLFLLVLAAEENDFTEIDSDEVSHALWLDKTIASILNDIAQLEDQDLEHKAALILRLCDEVTPHVGGQAAECLAALAHVYYTSAGKTNTEAHQLVWGTAAGQ